MVYKKLIIQYIIALLFFSICVGMASAQEDRKPSISTVTVLIEGFDRDGDNPISNYVWKIEGSRFITKTDNKPYPQKTYIQYTPFLLPSFLRTENEENLHILGIRAAFNIKGNNSISLTPTDQSKIGAKAGIFTYARDGKTFSEGDVIPGIYFDEPVLRIGIYALGILRDYYVQVEFENYYGVSFIVDLGDLNYRGWRILEADVPFFDYVKNRDLLNNEYHLRMNKITVRTGGKEVVDDFTVFFDSLFFVRPIQSAKEEFYDGYRLSIPGVSDTFEWETSEQ